MNEKNFSEEEPVPENPYQILYQIVDRGNVTKALLPTEEDALTLLYRLRASDRTGISSEYRVEPIPLVKGDVEPFVMTRITANISDTRETFKTSESSAIVWPTTARFQFIDARWFWERHSREAFGMLIVEGHDEEKVREVYKSVSESLRLDDEMRKTERLHLKWMDVFA